MQIGDRVKIVEGSHFKGPPLDLIGREGKIVSYVGPSPGMIVRFDNTGEKAAFYDDEMELVPVDGTTTDHSCPDHKLRETPLLIDALAEALRWLWDRRYTDGDESGVTPGYTIRLNPAECDLVRAVLARYQKEA